MSLDFFLQKNNRNRAWHFIYAWIDLLVGSKFWYSIQWIGPWKYENRKTFFSHRVQIKMSIFLKQRRRCVKHHCVIMHTMSYIYQLGTFKFRLLVRILDNWPIQLSMMSDNIVTSCLVILVLSPSKYSRTDCNVF